MQAFAKGLAFMVVGDVVHIASAIDIFHKKPHLLEGAPFGLYSGAPEGGVFHIRRRIVGNQAPQGNIRKQRAPAKKVIVKAITNSVNFNCVSSEGTGQIPVSCITS